MLVILFRAYFALQMVRSEQRDFLDLMPGTVFSRTFHSRRFVRSINSSKPKDMHHQVRRNLRITAVGAKVLYWTTSALKDDERYVYQKDGRPATRSSFNANLMKTNSTQWHRQEERKPFFHQSRNLPVLMRHGSVSCMTGRRCSA